MIEKFIKKNWYILSILTIVFIASFIRLYKLGEVPHGMTWDEAAIGYNGYAIFTTRRDEWLIKLPVSFQSFGDYKAPLSIYLNGVFTYLFGLNLFAVRLPFALFAVLAVLGIIFLTQEVFEKNKFGKYYALFAGFILTLSPWHIHYSRAGFESGMALSFLIWAIYFLVRSIKVNFKQLMPLLISVLLFVAAIYTYHSAKVTVPLIGLAVLILFSKRIFSNVRQLIIPVLVFLGLLIPFIKDSLLGGGLTRAGVTIFSSNLSIFNKLIYVAKSFGMHLSPDFLLRGATTTFRHSTGYLSVMYITTFFLVTAGVISLLRHKYFSEEFKIQIFFFLLVLAGILPAAIALEIPHSNRALLALPGFILLAIYGFDYLISLLDNSKINKHVFGTHKENNIIVKSFVGSVIALQIIFAISYLNNYFTVFAKTSTEAFNDGYIEAFEVAQKYEKGLGVEPVDRIIFTSKYGQPYIYALFVRKTNPIWYRGGSLAKYEFYDKMTINDLNRSNALIVGSGTDDLPIEKADYIIYGADGSVRFQIYRTKINE
jgi:hypothetical protein